VPLSLDLAVLEPFAYIGVLVFVLLVTWPLQLVLKARVYSKPARLILGLLPMLVLFLIWDFYAIDRGHWFFDEDRVTGVTIGILPIEELLFFITVPIASLLTFEAVRSIKGWVAGDESGGKS
jgi:lycopene cyclase domain-containing protein